MPSENELIAQLTKNYQRSPFQLNNCHESDAELVMLSPSGPIIAITTDSLSEEISSGLYDPYQIGWMTVMANASDLAAVGASPTGIVISEGIPKGFSVEHLEHIQKGIADASQQCQIPILGGDTNASPMLTMTGTALGWIPDGKPMTRKGCKPGDKVALTGHAGIGNLFAYHKFFLQNTLAYLPRARLPEGQTLKSFVSCCMDTSDGVFHTMLELGRLNNVGFNITRPLSNLVSQLLPSNLPSWIWLAGIHGEFELLCTIPQEKWEQVNQCLPLIEVGEIISTPGIQCGSYYFPPDIIQRCWNEAGNTSEYLHNLIQLEAVCQS